MNIQYYADRFRLTFPDYYTERTKRLTIFEKLLAGTLYDKLVPFYQEWGSGNAGYIPLVQRRPSIIYNIAQIIVEQVSSILFGENHFPTIKCQDSSHLETAKYIENICAQSNLKLKMLDAVNIGSVGSVAIFTKLIDGRFVFETLKTKNLRPKFALNDENLLLHLTEKEYYRGDELFDNGYNIKKEDFNKDYCIIREWTDKAEIYYLPILKSQAGKEDQALKVDIDRTCIHNLGFVPVVWIRNPHMRGNGLDGKCIFEAIIDIAIEIDYQLSQHGRGLKYNSDPTLVIKDPTRIDDEKMIKGIGALMLGQDGDAKLLQLDDSATTAVMGFVDKLRQLAMEVVRGDRSNPDKLLGGHSGKALKILNKPLVSLVSEMRIAYGEIGLKSIYKQVLCISNNSSIDIGIIENKIDSHECIDHLLLVWPPFYPETESDLQSIASTLHTLIDSGVMSKETATKEIAPVYKIQDIDEERTIIDKEQEKIMSQMPKIKETINA
jgi:hypothetical protein